MFRQAPGSGMPLKPSLTILAALTCGCTCGSALKAPSWDELFAPQLGEQPSAPPEERVVLLGIDGLDRPLLERMMADGDLPSFAQAIEQGFIEDLSVAEPIISPIIWTTIASGYLASEHGVTGWMRPGGLGFSTEDVRVARLWDVASEHGLRSLVSGWLVSWPAESLHGALLSDQAVWSFPMTTGPGNVMEESRKTLKEGKTWPPDLFDHAMRWEPDERWIRKHPLAYQVAENSAPTHPLVHDETQVRAFELLFPHLQPHLSLLYLSGADQVSHMYWPFTDPRALAAMRADPERRKREASQDRARMPGTRPYPWSDQTTTEAIIADGVRWVPDYYRYLDTILARVLAPLDPSRDTLLVCSDHGFESWNPTLTGMHRDPALLIGWGRRARQGASAADLSAQDMAPIIYALLGLPAARDMDGHARQELFELSQLPEPVASYRRQRAGRPSQQHHPPPQDPRIKQLEALGYVDDKGTPLPPTGAPGAPGP